MTPPEADVTEGKPGVTDAPPAVSVCVIETLKNRPDFLRAASARRQGTAGFLLQARARGDDSALVRVGFTASKKIGNAVLRNRAKRRLREVVRAVLPQGGVPGWDYVLVARPEATVSRAFALLLDDLRGALQAVHKGRT
ncbi:MAG: ribonuclease P protein component [Paracoccaceae bacterium]